MPSVNFRQYLNLQPGEVRDITGDEFIALKSLLDSKGSVYTSSEGYINPASSDKQIALDNSHGVINTLLSSMVRLAALKAGLSYDIVCSRRECNVREYHVLTGPKLGEGAFGKVVAAGLKITVYPDQAIISPVTDVVKIQRSADGNEIYTAAVAEGKKQNHFFPVKSVVPYNQGKTAITVMERAKGANLEGFDFSQLDFDQRLELINQLATQLDNIHSDKGNREAIVHRDLKPANIMYDKESGKAEILDFGVSIQNSEGKNNTWAGTPAYSPPDFFEHGFVTSAVDLYSFAGIVGEILGAKDILKNKEDNFNKYRGDFDLNVPQQCTLFYKLIAAAPFDFKNLLKGYVIPADVDVQLQQDIKTFLEKMSESEPVKRPTANQIMRFFSAISIRREYNHSISKNLDRLQTVLGELKGLAVIQQPALSSQQKRNEQVTTNALYLNKLQVKQHAKKYFSGYESAVKEVLEKLSTVQKIESHLTLLEKAEREQTTYQDQLTKQGDLTSVIEQLNQLKDQAQGLHGNLEEMKQAFTRNEIANKTNSSGLNKIIHLLENKEISDIRKLEKIIDIAKEKVTPGFSNWYSRSSIFGKGRQENVNTLYEKLAALPEKERDQKADAFAKDTLAEIETFVKDNRLTH